MDTLKDNGVGMNVEKQNQFRNGQMNMQGRIKGIGGIFGITDHDGTSISLRVGL